MEVLNKENTSNHSSSRLSGNIVEQDMIIEEMDARKNNKMKVRMSLDFEKMIRKFTFKEKPRKSIK